MKLHFKNREIDLFDFTSFFGLDFFKFSGLLCVFCPLTIGGLPPAYLNVRGHEDCLETVTNGGSSQYCFPVSKPGGCLNSAWEELLDVFEGDDCPEGIIVG